MNRKVALIYTRVSKLDARDRALSPATQLQLCKELPALHGLTVSTSRISTSRVRAPTASSTRRCSKRLDHGDAAIVAAYPLSRISRSVSDFYRPYEEMLQPHGIAFVSAIETSDTSTP